MPVLINNATGLAEDVAAPTAHQVPIMDADGNLSSVDPQELSLELKSGSRLLSPEENVNLLKSAHYSSPLETSKAIAETFAKNASFGLSTAAEVAKGVDPEAIRNREEMLHKNHPMLATVTAVGALAGGAVSGLGEGAALAKLGSAVVPEGITLGGKIAGAAARAGLENMAYQAGDEASRMFAQDPEQSAETAIANVGLAGLLGAGAGGALGAVPASWNVLMEGKAGKFVSDIKARAADRLANPDITGSLSKELSDMHQSILGMNSEVYGKTGLKAQEISKLMPEMSSAVKEEPIKIASKLQESIDKMREQPFKYGGERYPGLLDEALVEFKTATQDVQSPNELFDAMNELKQRVSRYIPKHVTPDNPAFDAIQEFKTVSKDIRMGLENKEVWGAAGERQAAVNKAFSEYLPKLKDFEKKFTVELNGERVVDPGKVNTYVNQLGKPNAEIKQEALKNFLDATDKYRQTIDDTHANLGIENPHPPVSSAISRMSLQEVTPGAKLADLIIDKGIGHVLGGTIGGAVGAGVGHPGIGALLGQHVLGSHIDRLVPALMKPLLESPVSGGGMRAALQYGTAVLKGENELAKAVKSVFKASRIVLTEPTEKQREKLANRVSELYANQDQLLDTGGAIHHYLPGHGTNLAVTAGRIVQYLAQLKPNTEPAGILDPPIVVSKAELSTYNQALNIAENPMLILKYLKEGSLTAQDVTHANAMYPALLQRMRGKLMDEVMTLKTNNEMMPYKTRMSLSVLLAMPLDSSMQPQAIVANQPVPIQQIQPSATSMAKISKLPNQYATPGQARAAKKSELT